MWGVEHKLTFRTCSFCFLFQRTCNDNGARQQQAAVQPRRVHRPSRHLWNGLERSLATNGSPDGQVSQYLIHSFQGTRWEGQCYSGQGIADSQVAQIDSFTLSDRQREQSHQRTNQHLQETDPNTGNQHLMCINPSLFTYWLDGMLQRGAKNCCRQFQPGKCKTCLSCSCFLYKSIHKLNWGRAAQN